MDGKHTSEQWLQTIAEKNRGQLRIYFGAVAGVGKTYSMLSAAHKVHAEGKNVLIGCVKTHKRQDTEAQIGELPILPAKQYDFRGHFLPEFDIDAAIQAKPDLLLVDELAHSNVQGSRHSKRWQDIEEILANGIDVWTTLNVQHLESLNDVVCNITGIDINETVPDAFFQSADEIILVDITAEELLTRLKDGKIYAEHKIRQATKNFFRKGNLISLREIALRRTAENVEAEVKTYRHKKSIDRVWHTDTGLLIYTYAGVNNGPLIRAGARLANQLHCEWHIVYIEKRLWRHRNQEQLKCQAIEDLEFAESLGAKTVILHGEQMAKLLVDYARQHNLSRIMGIRGGLWDSLLRHQIQKLGDEIDFIQLNYSSKTKDVRPSTVPQSTQSIGQQIKESTVGLCLMTALSLGLTFALWPFSGVLDNSNTVMLYLLIVVIASLIYNRIVGVWTAFLTVALFDFAFVEPKFSFAVRDIQYVLIFAVMLLLSLLLTHLTSYLRHRAREANSREQKAINLFDFAKTLSGLSKEREILALSKKFVKQEFDCEVFFLLPDDHGQLIYSGNDAVNLSIAKLAFQHQQAAGYGTNTLSEHRILYLPLMAPVKIRGILAIAAKMPESLLLTDQRRQLETFTRLIALTLERVHFADIANDILVEVEAEKMRNTLLSSVTHDLKTPLTAMVGEAEYLQNYWQKMPAVEIHQSIHSLTISAHNVQKFVSNILQMTRLESGQIQLHADWDCVEDIVSSTVRTIQLASDKKPNVQMNIEDGLPIIQFDAVLFSHAVSNLLENSIKYSQGNLTINVRVYQDNGYVWVEIMDNGIGISDEDRPFIFQKFYRAEKEGNIAGSGLGLSIVQMIMDAHEGKIEVAARQDAQGSIFRLALPITQAIKLEIEDSL